MRTADPKKEICISIPLRLLGVIDDIARKKGMKRSPVISRLLEEALAARMEENISPGRNPRPKI